MDEVRDEAQQGARGGACGRAGRAATSVASCAAVVARGHARRARVSDTAAAMPSCAGGFFGIAMPCHAFVLLSLVALACCSGCSREPAAELPPAAVDRVIDRADDPAYTNKLMELLAARDELAKRAASVARELEAARKENPESEKVKELERREKEIADEQEKQHKVSMAVIRRRMTQEIDEKEAAAKKAKAGK